MPKRNYSVLGSSWEEKGDGFVSPLDSGSAQELLLFPERIKNGSISADITPLESADGQSPDVRLEATLVCRYAGPDGFFYAGMAAWGTQFFTAKVSPGPFYQLREYVGSSSSVVPNRKYRLRVEFNGSQFTLFENDVQQLVMRDEGLPVGQCGLRTHRTRALFENVRIERSRPRAFIIMPFSSELDFVHGVVQKTVEAYEIQCTRADAVLVSRPVMDDVKTMIAEADIVIVDFTGRNPNVYYEAGLADAWKKDWIILAQSTEDLTFDVRHIRSITYSNRMGADTKLAADLGKALEALGYAPLAGRNP